MDLGGDECSATVLGAFQTGGKTLQQLATGALDGNPINWYGPSGPRHFWVFRGTRQMFTG